MESARAKRHRARQGMQTRSRVSKGGRLKSHKQLKRHRKNDKKPGWEKNLLKREEGNSTVVRGRVPKSGTALMPPLFPTPTPTISPASPAWPYSLRLSRVFTNHSQPGGSRLSSQIPLGLPLLSLFPSSLLFLVCPSCPSPRRPLALSGPFSPTLSRCLPLCFHLSPPSVNHRSICRSHSSSPPCSLLHYSDVHLFIYFSPFTSLRLL